MLRSRSISALAFCLLASVAAGQITATNATAPILGFIDISTTGTALSPSGDDTDHGFTSTIGNGLFPAGPCVMASNGHAVASATPNGFSYYYNDFTPIVPGLDPNQALGYPSNSQAVCAFWDDLYAGVSPSGTLYWQQIGNTLIMQWHNIDHFPSSPANGTIRFQIQVFGAVPCQGDTIQILYPDTVFDGVSGWDAGASATIGYISGAAGNAAYSHMTPSVPNGTCVTISKPPLFGVLYTSPFGGGSLQVNLCAGPANGGYFLAVTLAAGAYPNGWLYGIDISYIDLVNELTTGYPFVGGLDGAGTAQIGPLGGLPPGLVIYSVGFAGPAGPIPSIHSAPTAYAIP